MEQNIKLVKNGNKKSQIIKNNVQPKITDFIQRSGKSKQIQLSAKEVEEQQLKKAIEESKKVYNEEQSRASLLNLAGGIKAKNKLTKLNIIDQKIQNIQNIQVAHENNTKQQNRNQNISEKEQIMVEKQNNIVVENSSDEENIIQDIQSFKLSSNEEKPKNQIKNNFYNKNENIEDYLKIKQNNVLKPANTNLFRQKYQIQDNKKNVQMEECKFQTIKMDIEKDSDESGLSDKNSKQYSLQKENKQDIQNKKIYQNQIEISESSDSEENQNYFKKFKKKKLHENSEQQNIEENVEENIFNKKLEKQQEKENMKKINILINQQPEEKMKIQEEEQILEFKKKDNQNTGNKNNLIRQKSNDNDEYYSDISFENENKDDKKQEPTQKNQINQLNINFDGLDMNNQRRKNINYNINLPNERQTQFFNERKMKRIDMQNVENSLNKEFLQIHKNLETILMIPKNKLFFQSQGIPASSIKKQKTLDFYTNSNNQKKSINEANKNQQKQSDKMDEENVQQQQNDLQQENSNSSITSKAQKQEKLLYGEQIYIDIKEQKKKKYYQNQCQQMGGNVFIDVPDSFEKVTLFIYDDENKDSIYLKEIGLYQNVLIVNKMYLKKIFSVAHRNVATEMYKYQP